MVAEKVSPELLRALEEDHELHGLEQATTKDFNVFDALGEVRREIRHSNFLFFLLDPEGSHGLGDTLITRLLEQALPEMCAPHPEFGSTWLGSSSAMMGHSLWKEPYRLVFTSPYIGDLS